MAKLKRCPKCGASTVATSWVCAFCKYQFEVSMASEPPVRRQPTRITVLLGIWALIALLGAGIGIPVAMRWAGGRKNDETRAAMDYASWLTEFNGQLQEKARDNSGQFARSSPGSPTVARNVAAEERKALAVFMAYKSPATTQRLKNAYGKFLTDDIKFMQNVADGNPDLLSDERQADKDEVGSEIAELNAHNPSVGADLQGFELW